LYCAARYPEQEASLRQYLDKLYKQGLNDDDYRWLSPEQLAQQIRVAKPYGGIYAPHVATLHPAKLVRGLARTVERMGVRIYENSPVTQWQSGSLRTAQASVRSRWVVPAVEGYSVTLPPLGRYQLPVQSLIVATEPLSAATWDEIGLSRGQAFSESSRQVTYGQRTADNRLVFGARGGYQFAGKLRHDFDLTPAKWNCAAICSVNCSAHSRTCRSPTAGAATWACPGTSNRTCSVTAPTVSPVRRLWRGGRRCQQSRRAHSGRPDSGT
jgi:glycine/D-amino acid oxidase-like deaminating enzyme